MYLYTAFWSFQKNYSILKLKLIQLWFYSWRSYRISKLNYLITAIQSVRDHVSVRSWSLFYSIMLPPPSPIFIPRLSVGPTRLKSLVKMSVGRPWFLLCYVHGLFLHISGLSCRELGLCSPDTCQRVNAALWIILSLTALFFKIVMYDR